MQTFGLRTVRSPRHPSPALKSPAHPYRTGLPQPGTPRLPVAKKKTEPEERHAHMSDGLDTTPRIRAEEHAKRQRAVDFARGSVRLEGFVLGPEVEELNRRFIEGELTSGEHVAETRRLYDPTFRN